MKKLRNNTQASLRCIWAGMIMISIGVLVAEYTSYSRWSPNLEIVVTEPATTVPATSETTTGITTPVTTSVSETALTTTTVSTSISDSAITSVTATAQETAAVTQPEPAVEPKPAIPEPVAVNPEPQPNPINTETAITTIVNSSTDTPSATEPTVTDVTSSEVQDTSTLTYVKRFTRGTFYHTWGYPSNGGSGRALLDCSYDNGDMKGSIASSYLYSNYSYNYNGNRTKVYLEVYDKDGATDYSFMNGWYYVDDCDAWNPAVIDFYYTSSSNAPYALQIDGVVEVECWI